MNPRAAAACAVLLAALPAQKLPLPDGSDRQVVVVDVSTLLPPRREAPAPAARPGNRHAETQPSDVQRLAAFVRTFALPPGDPKADLQPLGEHHLVALGAPEQIAAVERLVAHAGKTHERQYQVDVRLCAVPARVFERDVAPQLAIAAGQPAGAATPPTAVLGATAAEALWKALKQSGEVQFTQFPQVVSPALTHAKLQVGDQLAYVRDFEIEVGNGSLIADPVVDVVFDGCDIDVFCAEVRAGTIGMQMQVVDQRIEKPIRTIETRLPGITVPGTLQVPHITGCRGSQTVELASGATAVMAAKKPDGQWLVVLTTLHEIR